eukprot:TRINITY_DN3357_c1_g1_i2.p1 TRINITY_DN3357_c1_g1~~TRINITY_DN3357_c1_g1_i2.p1  ORF type:complete len:419 (+),score=87.23 TRINITY_DN3357_c1_g1_i2:858-2114(+)
MEVGDEVCIQQKEEFEFGTVISISSDLKKAAVLWKGGNGVTAIEEVSDLTPRHSKSQPTGRMVIADENAQLRISDSSQLARRYSSRRNNKSSFEPTSEASNRTLRCHCGWDHIISPLLTRCQKCNFSLHQTCVGTSNSIISSCNFCDNNLPTDYSDNCPIPLPFLSQRFYSPSSMISKDDNEKYIEIMNAVNNKITSLGYTMRVLRGGVDGELQQQNTQKLCISACSSAVSEGFFDKKYPAAVFNEMRVDPSSRVLLLHGKGRSPAAVIATAANSSVPGDAQQIPDWHRAINLPLVTTNASHRKQGLARLLVLHELASWSAEGRTSAHLSMSLVKVTSQKGPAKFYFSEASKSLYELFDFKMVHPREVILEDDRPTCDFTEYETSKGVTMFSQDVPTAVMRNCQRFLTSDSTKRRKAG